MSRGAAAKSKIYVDEYDWSGLTNSIGIDIDVNLPDTTTFGDAAETAVEGKYGSKCEQNGFFDGASAGFDEKMAACIGDAGGSHELGVYLGNLATHGSRGYEFSAHPSKQPRKADVRGAVLLNISWVADGAIVRSTVLCNGASTGTGVVTNSTKNLGASVAPEGYIGMLRVLAVEGTGSITVKIEEADTEGGEYSDLFAFTAKTAIGHQKMRVITATKAWKRVNISALSGFTSVTLLVTAGVET